MSLILVGVNHRTAPVEIRERFSATEAGARDLARDLAGVPGVSGASYLSTCNRAEAIVSAEHEDVIATLVASFAQRSNLTPEGLEEHLYILRNRDVVRHMFRVAAGLDSMIVGEPQIGGQVRSAFQLANEAGTLDAILQKLMEQTMRVAKRVRTETAIGESAVSVPYAAVELAKKIFGDLAGLRVLLVGAGEMAELTAQHFSSFGLQEIFVANRAAERAESLALRFGGEAVRFENMAESLVTCDVVVASTSAPHYLVRPEHVRAALAARHRRNLFLIDLAVPRNIDPAVAQLAGAYLYDIDDLQQVANLNQEKRMRRAEEAEHIVDEEVDQFLRHLATLDAVPTILELQQHLEEIRQTELDKLLKRLGPISSEQRSAIEAMSTSMINKILHYPILRIKESAADRKEGPESIRETIRKLFGIR